jgi:hypothetical protein
VLFSSICPKKTIKQIENFPNLATLFESSSLKSGLCPYLSTSASFPFTRKWNFAEKKKILFLHSRILHFHAHRVASFFLVQHTKTRKNIPNDKQIYQFALKMYQMAIN